MIIFTKYFATSLQYKTSYTKDRIYRLRKTIISSIPVIPTKTKMPYEVDSLLNNPQTKALDMAHKQQGINKQTVPIP